LGGHSVVVAVVLANRTNTKQSQLKNVPHKLIVNL